jgi:hypothetical protein
MRPGREDGFKLVMILKLVLQFVDFCFSCLVEEDLIKLINQLVESTYEAEKAFRNENTPIVLALVRSLADVVTNVVYNVLKSFSPILNLFRDNHQVRLCLQSTFKSKMRRLFTHKSDEVPVLHS